MYLVAHTSLPHEGSCSMTSVLELVRKPSQLYSYIVLEMSRQRMKPRQLNRLFTCFCCCCSLQHQQLYSADQFQPLRAANLPRSSRLWLITEHRKTTHPCEQGAGCLEPKQRNVEDKQRRLTHISTLNLEVMVQVKRKSSQKTSCWKEPISDAWGFMLFSFNSNYLLRLPWIL